MVKSGWVDLRDCLDLDVPVLSAGRGNQVAALIDVEIERCLPGFETVLVQKVSQTGYGQATAVGLGPRLGSVEFDHGVEQDDALFPGQGHQHLWKETVTHG